MALEQQHPVGQEAARGQRLAQALRHRPQVFADDHAGVAHAFERNDAREVLEIIANIAARGARHAVRNPEQARQCHHVVDAQCAGALHVGRQYGAPGRVTARRKRARNPRRQTPVLPCAIEEVRWRAHARALREQALVAPAFGAVGGGAHS